MSDDGCPLGYVVDNTLFHAPDCASFPMPSLFLGYFLIEIGIVSFVLIGLSLLHVRKARKELFRLLVSAILIQMNVLGVAVSLYIQNGMLEAAPVFLFLFYLSMFSFIRILMKMTLNPAVSMTTNGHARLKKIIIGFHVYIGLLVPIIFGFCCAMIIFCRGQSYNSIMSAHFIFTGAVIIPAAILIFVNLNRLMQVVANSIGSSRLSRTPGEFESQRQKTLQDFYNKLVSLRFQIFFRAAVTTISNFAVGGVGIGLGYFPGSFVYWACILNVYSGFCLTALMFLQARKKGSAASSSSRLAQVPSKELLLSSSSPQLKDKLSLDSPKVVSGLL